MNLLLILKRALQKRRALFHQSSDTCFRLFNSSADGIEGLTIDLYGGYLLGQSFHGDVKCCEDEAAAVAAELCAEYGKPVAGVVWKERMKGENAPADKIASRLIWGTSPNARYAVRHNGMLLFCDLLENKNTGIFMDMRDVRNALMPYYGTFSSMLNLFSYTGAFSIHALRAGVMQCTNVDSSKAAHARAKDNYRLNGIVPDDRDFIAGDAEEWMKIFIKKKKLFSFIVYDPPTFSRAKRSHFSIRRDFRRHCEMLHELASGGYVLTAMNTVSVPKEEYISYHPRSWKRMFIMNEAEDFRFVHDPYLKVALWKLP